jgi:signal peptidase I
MQRYWSIIREYVEALIIIIPLAFLIRSFGYGLYRVPTGSMEPTMLVGERFFADKLTPLFSSPHRGNIITFNDPTYHYSTNPIVYSIQRYMWGPSNLTKRVIGIPGDRIQGKMEQGKPVIYLNGTKLEEPYVNPYPLIPVSIDPQMWRTYVPDKPYDRQPFYHMDKENIEMVKKWYERRGLEPVKLAHTPLPEMQGTDVFDILLGENQYWVMGDNRLGSSDSREWGPLDGKFIHGKVVYRLWSIDTDSNWLILDIVLHPIDVWHKIRRGRNFQALNKNS